MYCWHFAHYLPTSSCQRSFWMTPNQYSKILWIPFLYYCTSQSFYVAKIQCWHLWPSLAMKVEWKLLIFKGFLIRNFNTFMSNFWPYQYQRIFWRLRTRGGGFCRPPLKIGLFTTKMHQFWPWDEFWQNFS